MATRPPILYKYLDRAGAEAFLKQPQLRYKDFRELDDLMEVLPGFRSLSQDEAAELGRLRAQSGVAVQFSLEKHAFFLKTLSEVDPRYLEDEFRKQLAHLPPALFICSLTERADSVAMWSSYAEKHQGIVFGLSTAVDWIIAASRRALVPVVYSDCRIQMPFPIVVPDVIGKAVRFKSTDWQYQSEWRLISSSDATDFLAPADVAEVVVGYRASDTLLSVADRMRASGVRVFRAVPDSRRYRIELREENPKQS